MAVGMFLSCGNTDKEIQEVSHTYDGPLETSEGVTMYFSDQGEAQIKLESPLMHRYLMEENEMRLECPTGMKVTFYDSIGEVESVLTANYGEMYSNKEFIKVKDDVVFINNKDEELNTELLHVDFKKDSVYTHEKVVVSSPKGTISGVGLHSNSNFTKYKVHNINNGVYNMEENALEKNMNNNE
ncbi:LPS export ABC transporter periplasmic protein LptC [Parvicella tangerina]|uniref:Lipopolysaccharide export system protein LptC n=1 Tax=Parvicella tangerina TaxID=2829795 RepID=A0A916JRU5_9FLAO|nr:LPS export ABC transporter periplasmic protein LptC [Parvicella tangerina]CAG5087867.1 Lipopolysaccharide export system protein LptC [Parvicella tangerina]